MQPVSSAYSTAIINPSRVVRIDGTITLLDQSIIEITDANVVKGSLYRSFQCVSGDDIDVGSVYVSELGLSLITDMENPYSLDGARIALSFGILTEEDAYEYVPLGYYYVHKIARKHQLSA